MARRSIKSLKKKARSIKKYKSTDKWKKRRSVKKALVTAPRYRFNAPDATIGLPNVRFQTLYYRTCVKLEVAAGIAGAYVMRVNDLFDPEFALGGHQPMGRDQISQFYGKYQVIGTKLKGTFTNGGIVTGGAKQPTRVGINMDTDTSLFSFPSVNSQIEHQLGRYNRLLTENSRERAIVTGTYSAKKFWKKYSLSDPEMFTTVGTSPTSVAYAQFWAANIDSDAANDHYVYCEIEMWQRVKWIDPISQATS